MHLLLHSISPVSLNSVLHHYYFYYSTGEDHQLASSSGNQKKILIKEAMPGFLKFLKHFVCCKGGGGDYVDRDSQIASHNNHAYSTKSTRAPPPLPSHYNIGHQLVESSNIKPEISDEQNNHESVQGIIYDKRVDTARKLKRKKSKETRVQKGNPPTYVFPCDFRDLIKRNIIPEVLNIPLTPFTYGAYFAALLYAEDYYIEKWSNCLLQNVTLKFYKSSMFEKARTTKNSTGDDGEKDILVAFEIDKIYEELPVLLPGDTVLVRHAGLNIKPFQGCIRRVEDNDIILAGFGDDFHSRHLPHCVYDITFSFDRFSLKRCIQAVGAAMDPLFLDFMFPNPKSTISFFIPPYCIPSHPNMDYAQASTVYHLSRLKTTPPYLIEGPRCVTRGKELSSTGLVIQQAVLQICRMSPCCRILINAPSNGSCDVLMRNLLNEMPKSDVFRANAAFRDDVPCDILPLCPIERGCFTCPSLQELRNFKVILSTYVSSSRLQQQGISSGHFTHIFLVDASSAIEPETMIPLANLVDANTIVVVSGSATEYPHRVRSDIAQQNGLRVSYFQRLFESEPYCTRDPMFLTSLSKIRRRRYG